MTESRLVTSGDIEAARARLAGVIGPIPLVREPNSGILLKAENLHPSGSFKLRGAFNSMLLLDGAQRRTGVIAHSSGNHAIAVAMAAAALGVRAVVVMPADAPAVKRDRTIAAGAEVVEVGPSSAERAARAAQLARELGLALIEPYDSDAVLAATGTIGVEILADLDALDRRDTHGGTASTDRSEPIEVFAPVSGGGLIGGLAAGLKQGATRRDVRVVGVEPELAADALASWRAGERVELSAAEMARIAADGLRVQRVGVRPWRHLRAFVDDIVTVSEEEIRAASRAIAVEARLVTEPSGAVAAAAALAGRGSVVAAPRRVAVLSGGNVDPLWLADVLADRR